MARTPLTVNSITNGGGTPVDVQTSLAAWNADDHSFANGTDMRTFIVVKNASGATRTLTFDIPLDWDGQGGNPIPFRAFETGVTPGLLGTFTVELPDAKTEIYGPFRPYWFNQSDGTVYVDIDAEASVTVAAFKLPWYDGIHGDSSGTPESATNNPSAAWVPETITTTQTIVPEGVEATFNDHSDIQGWLLPLNTMRRRMAWIRNNTVGSVVVIQVGGAIYAPPLSSGSSEVLGYRFRSDTMAASAEWFLGPWDERGWCGFNDSDTTNDHLWIYTDAGISADVDIAWLELPA